ncbi:MAG: glutamine--tRNA ligase/YqeY domain fusion protein [Trueperaceae bacterium]|nr:glutamine--tRNA ligase/YqeY domain fusion protein [Trueperaceae bacterium]
MSTNAPTHNKIPDDEARIVTPNFITDVIDADLESGKHDRIVTRFPPEPNGYLHIGHAKSICLNAGLALDYGGQFNLRFDDTNPTTEDIEYVEAIRADVRWLGFDWGEHLYHASDFFEELYQYAEKLIRDGKAYVDSLSEEEIRAYRGTVTEPGRNSPYRKRSVEENLDLFRRMKAGEFEDGAHVLRAKGDMASTNMKMRDPLLYRIRHAHHYRTGDAWCIYPMYDYAHPLCDALEHVTHSLCSLEFENNREVYDWAIEHAEPPARPQQYEFARLQLDYTVLSKRKLIELVRGKYVSGWDDPRLPTVAGLRRRGVTPAAIRDFANRVGVAKANSRTDIALLEHSIRDDLNMKAPRVMAVLEPLKLVITNYPEGQRELLDAPYYPHDVPKEGSRGVPFSREVYIERGDFMEEPPKGFYRLSPGAEVRLRYGYVVRCDEVIKDDQGHITELRGSYDPDTLGKAPEGRKVRGAIQWVSVPDALDAEVRLYDRLFNVADPDAGEAHFSDHLNPDSLVTVRGFVEPSVATDADDTRYQFERQGYFIRDNDSTADALVFNRIVPLRDSWAKQTTEPAKPDPKKAPTPEPQKAAPTPDAPRNPVLEFTPAQKSRFTQYVDKLGLSDNDAALLAGNEALADYFDAAVNHYDDAKSVANWVVNELSGAMSGSDVTDIEVSPEQLAGLVRLINDDVISNRIGKDVLAEMLATGSDADTIVEAKGLRQISDEGELEPIVTRLISDNSDKVDAYRNGKTGLLGFFVGQVMRETGGQANPQMVQKLVQQKLG